jgi:nitrite reductase/ring-hydroxylating ferredoxin subunit
VVSERLLLCRADELEPGGMRGIPRSDGRSLAVYNVDGDFYATDATCTHAQADLTEGDLEGDVVVCPVHMGEFCVRTGAALSFPVTRPLRVYPVELADGAVWALLGDETEAAA